MWVLDRPVSQHFESLLFVSVKPLVEGLPADPVVPAGLGDVARHILGMLQDREPVPHQPLLSLSVIRSPCPVREPEM
jgi:hypothetical protein